MLTFYSNRQPQADVVVDVTAGWEVKLRAVEAHSSQVHRESKADRSEHPEATSDIVGRMTARARCYGAQIRADFGEPLGLLGPLDWTAADLFGGP